MKKAKRVKKVRVDAVRAAHKALYRLAWEADVRGAEPYAAGKAVAYFHALTFLKNLRPQWEWRLS